MTGRRLAASLHLARTVDVAVAIRGRSAAAIPLLVGPLTFAGMLVGLVMADDAARTRPEQPVMAGKMPHNTADHGAL